MASSLTSPSCDDADAIDLFSAEASIDLLPLQSRSNSLQPTIHTDFERERKSRTNDVRERFGPMFCRYKASVTKMQKIENSITIHSTVGGDDDDDDDINNIETALGGQQSRRRKVNESIEIIKEKMMRLRNMEEELAASEDRRENLHWLCLKQTSLQALGKIQRYSDQIQTSDLDHRHRIAEVGKEKNALNGKSSMVDELLAQNVRLLEKANDAERLEKELANASKLHHRKEMNFQQQQHKLDEKVAECNKLELQMKDLQDSCDRLKKALHTQEERDLNFELELELVDLKGFQNGHLYSGKNSLKPTHDPGTSPSIAATEPLTLSWTESSITSDRIIVDNDDNSTIIEPSLSVPIRVMNRESIDSDPFVQNLMAKIEALTRENAELRHAKSPVIAESNPTT
ncbi:unnamed protein product [Pseudo-nitzschia multistriata]|uniref:Uncharacterized protein n=1 Tax=Pseudo-nitzschia multistriata TaxID=183589 RepID=A0A448Z906_9STRA|nr:unnamed protein product [Pseudo-nitzschia multistriata]